jgi:hypothetical protein
MFLPSVSLSIVILPSIFRVCDFTLSFFFKMKQPFTLLWMLVS